MVSAWVAGLLVDSLTGSLLGQHALTYVLIAWAGLSLHQRLRMYSGVQQTLIVFLTVLGAEVLAALLLRAKTGEGAFIDVDMTRNVSALLTFPRAEAATGASVEVGEDLLVGSVAAYRVYATADGHLAVGALEPHFWLRFCDAVVDACPDLADADLVSHGLSKGADGRQ